MCVIIFPLHRHHEIGKDNSMVLSNWEKEAATASTLNSHSTRAMKFMKVCNLPGLKQTRATKSQKWRKCGTIGLVLYTSTKLDDVPMADCFTVDDCIIVKAVGNDKVSIDATMEVKFVKSTMMRSMIESSTNKEVCAWLKEYLACMKKYAKTRPGASAASASGNGKVEEDEPLPVTVVSDTGPLHPIDAFFDSIGFSGGRYICVIFAIILITMIFFAYQWRSARGEIRQLRNDITLISEQLKKLIELQNGLKNSNS